MKHFVYGTQAPTIAILIKSGGFVQDKILKEYVEPMRALGITDSIVALPLQYNKKKVSVAFAKQYLSEDLLPKLNFLNIKTIFCCDTEYFKVLTKNKTATPHLGYVCPLKFEEPAHKMDVIYGINHGMFFFKPEARDDLNLALKKLSEHLAGTYQELGKDIIKTAIYPKTVSEIETVLNDLAKHPVISCDIEAFSLKHYSAGIGTIGFAWNKHEGTAFPVDYTTTPEDSKQIRDLLFNFFMNYKGKVMYHNICYDAYVLIYQLFMKDLLDQEGLLKGLDVMLRDFDCTKIISYLAVNSCSGNSVGLKTQAHEFAGNYAVDDIKDITKIDIDTLLEYNLVDCLCTWYVKEKNAPIMLQDHQETIYEGLFKDSVVDVIQMQLTGFCMDPVKVAKLDAKLTAIINKIMDDINNDTVVKDFTLQLKNAFVEKRNQELKTKQITIADAGKIKFNPNSNPQMQKLIYEVLGLPPIDFTPTKAPAVGGKTLAKLLHFTKTPETIALLENLIAFSSVDKIMSSFIPNFVNAPEINGIKYLFGNFNIGGTLSGRLSSSNPNLQQIPSGSEYAKLIKDCFIAPPGQLLIGIDFDSLEDYMSALTTKDPNKLKIYLDGFDGHAIRAHKYFPESMPDIQEKLDKLDKSGKFYKIEKGGSCEYYHEHDLPAKAKAMLKI